MTNPEFSVKVNIQAPVICEIQLWKDKCLNIMKLGETETGAHLW